MFIQTCLYKRLWVMLMKQELEIDVKFVFLGKNCSCLLVSINILFWIKNNTIYMQGLRLE